MIISNDTILLRLSIGYTLVDITHTNVVSSIDSKERNQQRNWQTLVQTLGLRAQLLTLSSPQILDLDVTKSQFGSNYTGHQLVWTFKFGTEQDGVFSNENNPFGTLESDFINVPIILGLNETAQIATPTFCIDGPERNIYFEQLRI
jgi:hypothetical protein